MNRSALIVTPKQPFLDWLYHVDPTSEHLTLRDLSEEPTLYLIGACESDADFGRRLRHSAPLIFEDMLDGWWTERSSWPTDRTIRTFRKWFDVELYSLMLDSCGKPLRFVG